jgi:hypothetical protein
VTGQLKFATVTASVERGQRSGKNDYAVVMDANRDFQSLSVFGSLGYQWLGKPDGVELKNVVYGSLGTSYKLTMVKGFSDGSPDWGGGLKYTHAL